MVQTFLQFLDWTCAFIKTHTIGSVGKEFACKIGGPGWENPLEKEMAIHSSIPAWRIPWTEGLGKL